MKINGVELEIDFTDADLLEKIEKGSKDVFEKTEEIKKMKLAPAEGIRQECKMLKDFLDYVLGDGTSEKIFGDKDSLKQCIKAFKDIIDTRDAQITEFMEIANEYSPDRLKR